MPRFALDIGTIFADPLIPCKKKVIRGYLQNASESNRIKGKGDLSFVCVGLWCAERGVVGTVERSCEPATR